MFLLMRYLIVLIILISNLALAEILPNKTDMNALLKDKYEIIEIHIPEEGSSALYILQKKNEIYHCIVRIKSAKLFSCNPLN